MPLQRDKERSKRKRENETHSEIQGAEDTVINITKSTQQRQTKDTTKCKMEKQKKKKNIFGRSKKKCLLLMNYPLFSYFLVL